MQSTRDTLLPSTTPLDIVEVDLRSTGGMYLSLCLWCCHGGLLICLASYFLDTRARLMESESRGGGLAWLGSEFCSSSAIVPPKTARR